MTTLQGTIETCFSPIGIVTLLFVVGLVLNAFRRTSPAGRRLVWAGGCLYLVVFLAPLAEILVFGLERPFPPMRHVDASAGVRAIVVLADYGENIRYLPVTSKLSMEATVRVVEGIRLSRELPGVPLVVSGGVLSEGDTPVAQLMADLARAMGVPEAGIVIEGKSTTTYENLVEVRKIVGSEPFILVTSAYHLRRATAVAHKLGMKPLAAPAAIWAARSYPAGTRWLDWTQMVVQQADDPSTSRFAYLQSAYHEYVGYVWYWILGRV